MVAPRAHRTAFVGRASLSTVVRSGPILRTHADGLRFWETEFGDLLRGALVPSVPLWKVLRRTAAEKVGSGALDTPSQLLEYANVLKGIGVVARTKKVSSIGSDKLAIAPGTFLYGKMDPDGGRICITDNTAYIASPEFVPFEVYDEFARPRYLQLVLLLPEALASLGLLKAGKCQQRADVDKLLRCTVPLPPLDDQDRCLAAVTLRHRRMENTARKVPGYQDIVDRGLANIFAITAPAPTKIATGSLQQSTASPLLRLGYRYLSTAKSFDAVLAQVGPTVPFSRVCIVRGGKRVPPGTQYSDSPTEHQFLRGSDIKRGSVNFDDLAHINSDTFERISEAAPKPNDVLLTVAGVVGKAAWPGALSNIAVTDNVSILTPREPDRLLPEYLMYVLLSSFMQIQFQREMSELRQQKISLEKLRSLRFPTLPTVQEQQDALTLIRQEFEEALKLRKEVALLKEEIDVDIRLSIGLAPPTLQEIAEDVPAADFDEEETSDSEAANGSLLPLSEVA